MCSYCAYCGGPHKAESYLWRMADPCSATTIQLGLTSGPKEVEEAEWYSTSEIEKAINQGKIVLSPEDSITRFLIREWVRKSHGMTEL